MSCFLDISPHGRYDVRAASRRHLNRVASYAAGRSHHYQTVASGDAEKLKRPQRRDARHRQHCRLLVRNVVGYAGQRLGRRAGYDGGVLGVGPVRAGQSENAIPDMQGRLPWRDMLDHASDIDSEDKGEPRA